MEASLLIRLIDQVTGPAGKVRDALKGVGDMAGEMKRGFNRAIRDGFSVENIETATRNAEAALSRARSRLIGAVGTGLALAAPLKMAGQFDQAMKGLEKVLDAPVDRLLALRRYALETSALIPIAARDVVELMAEAAQGGVPQEELEAFTTYVANAAVAFDMAGQEIGDRFAKLRNVYKLTQDGIEDLGDATNHLSNNMAAKAEQITDFANRAAGAAAIFELTATQTAAVGAAMIAAGIVPETAGRGFTAMATRILSGGKEVDGAFKSIGMNRRAFLQALEEDAPAALESLFNTLATHKNGMQALIDIVGRDFADDFAKFLGNPELLRAAFDLVADRASYAGSAVEEAAKQAAGAEKRWELLTNKLSRMAIVLGDQLLPAALEAADAIGGVLDKMAAFAAANPELTATAVQAVAALMALSVASRLAAWAFAGTRVGLLAVVRLLAMFDKSGRNVGTGWRALAVSGRLLWMVVSGLAWAAGGLVTVLAGITAPVWAVIAALAAAAFALWKYWDAISSFTSGFASVLLELSQPLAEVMSQIGEFGIKASELAGVDTSQLAAGFGLVFNAARRLVDVTAWVDTARAAIDEFGGWISGFFSRDTLTDDEKGAYYDAGRRMAERLVQGIKDHLSNMIKPVQDLFNFTMSIDWPEPPAWLSWLIEKGGGLVDGVSDTISGKDDPTAAAAGGGVRGWINNAWDDLFGSGKDVADQVISGAGVAGDKLGGAASERLNAGAAAAGNAFGNAAVAVISKARVNVGVGGGLSGAISAAKTAALHGGTE
jgi:TP901 family phage tail tape measure protein